MTGVPGRVLVLDGGTRGGLAAVRELGDRGWTVGLGTPHGETYAAHSRHVRARHLVRPPGPDPDELVEDIERVQATSPYDIVVGCGDHWLVALSRHRARMPLPVAHPTEGAVTAIMDVAGRSARCADAGIHSPPTWWPEEPVPAGVEPPFIVKPPRHDPSTGGPRAVPLRVRRAGDLAQQVAAFRDVGVEPVVQSELHGRLMALSGVMVDGRLVARVQQVAIRTWPVPYGVSCRATTTAIDDDLARRLERLLDGLGWQGMIEAQFLRLPDGKPSLIDLNGRPYGSLALAQAAGVSLVDLSLRSFMGHDLSPRDGVPGRRYQWLGGDLKRAVVERRGGLVVDVAATAAMAARARHSVWSWRDPRPAWRIRVRNRLVPPATVGPPPGPDVG